MSKRVLFRKIVARSVLMGLQAGAALGLAAGCLLMIPLGFWAAVAGLGYGCAVGAVMGLINGLLLGRFLCRFFPDAQNSGFEDPAMRRAAQTRSIAVSLLVTAPIAAVAVAAPGAKRSFVGEVSAIMLSLVGVAAWWASWRVTRWYEALIRSAAYERVQD